jgi:hypothetical protein
MNIVTQGDRVILSNPTTVAERQFMEKVADIARETGSSKVEFVVDAMGMNGNTTHVGLTPVIPDGFQFDSDTHSVERVHRGCHICGEDH